MHPGLMLMYIHKDQLLSCGPHWYVCSRRGGMTPWSLSEWSPVRPPDLAALDRRLCCRGALQCVGTVLAGPGEAGCFRDMAAYAVNSAGRLSLFSVL